MRDALTRLETVLGDLGAARAAWWVVEERVKGLDLALYHEDVRRLSYACPAFRSAVAAGLDRDDLLAEVYRSIEVRNQGDHPYDPAKGSRGTWVTMVARSVAVNELAKARGQERRDAEVARVARSTIEGAALGDAYDPSIDPSVEYPQDSAGLRTTPPPSATGAPMPTVDPPQVVRRRTTTLDRKAPKRAKEARLRFPPDMHRELTRLAREGGQPMTWWVQRFVAEGIARMSSPEREG